jgi:hypothetical protein
MITISLLILPSCVSSGGRNTKVNVVQDDDANTRNDQTGEWNDADMRDTAKTLIDQMVLEAWYEKALKKKESSEEKLPTVKIGKIKNKTDGHLPIDAFNDGIKRTLINSGKITFIANSEDTQKVRKSRDDEMNHVTDDSAKEDGEEIATDYMLLGQFTSMSDRLGGREVKYLQVNLRLVDTEKNVIVWVGEKKIKKFVQQRSRTW